MAGTSQIRTSQRERTGVPRRDRGQSLIETALLIPLLLILGFNAANFGYFFAVAVNLAAAPRNGAQYSIMGFQSYPQSSLPPPGPTSDTTSVGYTTLADITGALRGSSGSVIRVCTKASGTTGSGVNQKSVCTTYGTGPALPAVDADPEAPYFVLNRVDIQYTVQPLIPAAIFGLPLTPSLSYHRQVSMRALD